MDNNVEYENEDAGEVDTSDDENPLLLPKKKYTYKKPHVLSEKQVENLAKGRQRRLERCEEIRQEKELKNEIVKELKNKKMMKHKPKIDAVLKKLEEEGSEEEEEDAPKESSTEETKKESSGKQKQK